MSQKTRNTKLMVLGAVLVVVGCLVVLIIMLRAEGDHSFSSDLWRDKAVYRTNARLGMADDLIARRLLDGKTRAEVLAILGPEEKQRPFRDEHLVYYLGPERSSFPIDSE